LPRELVGQFPNVSTVSLLYRGASHAAGVKMGTRSNIATGHRRQDFPFVHLSNRPRANSDVYCLLERYTSSGPSSVPESVFSKTEESQPNLCADSVIHPPSATGFV
jgi:hypothetical protein